MSQRPSKKNFPRRSLTETYENENEVGSAGIGEGGKQRKGQGDSGEREKGPEHRKTSLVSFNQSEEDGQRKVNENQKRNEHNGLSFSNGFFLWL